MGQKSFKFPGNFVQNSSKSLWSWYHTHISKKNVMRIHYDVSWWHLTSAMSESVFSHFWTVVIKGETYLDALILCRLIELSSYNIVMSSMPFNMYPLSSFPALTSVNVTFCDIYRTFIVLLYLKTDALPRVCDLAYTRLSHVSYRHSSRQLPHLYTKLFRRGRCDLFYLIRIFMQLHLEYGF